MVAAAFAVKPFVPAVLESTTPEVFAWSTTPAGSV